MPLALAAQAMGTRFELVLLGGDGPRERAAGEAALEALAEWDRRLSAFRRDSLLSHVNREARERAVAVDPETFELLGACARLWRESEGAFDAAVGEHMRQQGFRGEGPGEDVQPAGFAAVELDPRACRVRFTRPGVQLDLGGIAKGFALDAAAAVLREVGIAAALLHGGTSTIVAIGAPPDLDGWRIALEPGPASPVAELRDAALSVSAPHGRRNERDEGHVLDPRSGRPLPDGGLAAVVAPSGLLADGWSTALLVLGELPDAARAQGVAGLVAGGRPGSRRWRATGARGPFVLPAS